MSFISWDRATTHPSLEDKTTTGTCAKSGRNNRSHDTKKLLQSMSPICCLPMYRQYNKYMLCSDSMNTTTIDTRFFRAGVGTVIYNHEGKVAWFERAQHPVGVWQFQQGGIDLGEDTKTTLWRELTEEVGLTQADFESVHEYPNWTVYQYDYTIADATKSRLGQVHRWYFLQLRPGVEIDLRKATEQEASAVRFITFDEVLTETSSFRKHVYQELRDYFESHILQQVPS